jgi:hypothetical protein
MRFLYRHKGTGILYLLYLVSPMKYTGSWIEAVAYLNNANVIKNAKLKDFVKTAEIITL